MVNVTIYLKTTHNSRALVATLLKEKLIASASIDEKNISYKLIDSEMIEEHYNVITAQSKALLFDDIVSFVENVTGEEVPIVSTPIVGSNRLFDSIIRTKTIPI